MEDRDGRSHFKASSFNPRRTRVDTPQRAVGCGRRCQLFIRLLARAERWEDASHMSLMLQVCARHRLPSVKSLSRGLAVFGGGGGGGGAGGNVGQ